MNKYFFIFCACYLVLANHHCEALYKIAIEGMPGAGKTTTLMELISELDKCVLFPELHPEPGTESNEFCENCEGDIYHQMQVARMYLIDKLPKEIEAVLLDRSFYSNYAYKFATYLNQHNSEYNSEYEEYVCLFHKAFDHEKFELIVFLDAQPETGLLRRGIRGDKIPEPWNDIRFLTEFRNFYIYELPKLTDSPILHIVTDDLSSDEVKTKIRNELRKWISLTKTIKILKKEEEHIIDFARKHDLGESHSKIVDVLGYPAMYFREHGVVLFDDVPAFFSNQTLKKMIHNRNPSLLFDSNGAANVKIGLVHFFGQSN